jgi:hypothetical protein
MLALIFCSFLAGSLWAGTDFQKVVPKELVRSGLKSTIISSQQETYQWNAYLHTEDIFQQNEQYASRRELNYQAPVRPFQINVSSETSVVINENDFKIIQKIIIHSSSISILRSKELDVVNEIRLEKGDTLLSNGKGEIIFKKAPRPPVFQPRNLLLNANFETLLNVLHVQSQLNEKEGVCFRDDFIKKGSRDCQRLIFTSPYSWAAFDSVKIDLNTKSIIFN